MGCRIPGAEVHKYRGPQDHVVFPTRLSDWDLGFRTPCPCPENEDPQIDLIWYLRIVLSLCNEATLVRSLSHLNVAVTKERSIGA